LGGWQTCHYYSIRVPSFLEAKAIRLHTGSAGSFFTLKRYRKTTGNLLVASGLSWCGMVVVTEIYANVLLSSKLCVELQNGYLAAI